MTAANTEDIWKENPAQRLTKGFEEVFETRMKDMPFNHPKVHVEAVGFRRWQDYWFGVMVTPWSMNFILAEGRQGKWKSVQEGRKLHYNFPAGCYDFISVKDKLLGEYQMCSLFSPLAPEITDHNFAVAVASAAIDEIMKEDDAPEELGQQLVPETQPLSQRVEEGLKKPVSRKEFFHRKPDPVGDEE